MNVLHRPAPAGPCRDRGYVFIFAALLLVPMCAAVGFSTDVGAWYVRGSEIQRASDAAALAGVVWMPDAAKAEAAAIEAAKQNGFDPADPRYTLVSTPIGDSSLEVTITDNDVEMYFSRIVLDNIDITRASTARYVKPVPLGSPVNQFGNSDLCSRGGCSQGFWLAINGPYSLKSNGDPFATRCNNPASGASQGYACSGGPNSDFRDDGYWYAVEVSQAMLDSYGGSVPIEFNVFDGIFFNRFSGTNTDNPSDFAFSGAGPVGPDMRFEVFNRDNTPLDHTDNPSFPGGSCVLALREGTTVSAIDNEARICRVVVSKPGIFPINVRATDLSGTASLNEKGNATNQYSLNAKVTECGSCTGAIQPRIYALNDFSFYANVQGGSAEFFLAEITEDYRGKEVTIEFYDPGDANRTGSGSPKATLKIINPVTGTPFSNCTWTATNGLAGAPTSGCAITTYNGSTKLFDGEWLTIKVRVPNSYSCSGVGTYPCWWKVRYDIDPGLAPTDRVTVQVSVSGDPIKLVE